MTQAIPAPLPDSGGAIKPAAGGSNPRPEAGENGAKPGEFSSVLAKRVEAKGKGERPDSDADSKTESENPTGKPVPKQADKNGKGLPADQDKVHEPAEKAADKPDPKEPVVAVVPPVAAEIKPLPEPAARSASTQTADEVGLGGGAPRQNGQLPPALTTGTDTQPVPGADGESVLDQAGKLLTAGQEPPKSRMPELPVAATPVPTPAPQTQATPAAAVMVDNPFGTATAPNAAGGTPAATTTVPVPVNQPGWDSALGQRVQWLVSNNIQSAHLHLNPPDLGPVEVRIAVHHDQASVMFSSHHAAVRDALDGAIPRLREALGEQGLNLVNVNVSQHSFGQGQHSGTASGGDMFGGTGTGSDAGGLEETPTSVAVRASLGLVDYYA